MIRRNGSRVVGLVVAWVGVAGLLGAAGQARADGLVAYHTNIAAAVLSQRVPINLSPCVYNPNQGPLTFTLLQAPVAGTLEDATTPLTAGVSTPATNWYYSTTAVQPGTDSFTWEVRDDTGNAATGTVAIALGTNTPVTVQNQTFSVQPWPSKTSLSLSFFDPDTYQTNTFQLVTAPMQGWLLDDKGSSWSSSFNEDLDDDEYDWKPCQSWRYRPLSSATGTDSFTWRASDGLTTSETAVVTFTFGNNPPRANNQTSNVTGGGWLALAFTDPDVEQSRSFYLTTAPAHGCVEYYDGTSYKPFPPNGPVGTNKWRYIAEAGFAGTDSFQWKVSDQLAESAPATYTLHVTTNVTPIAYGMRLYVTPGGSVSADADFTDPDTNQVRVAEIMEHPAHGAVAVTLAGGAPTFTYTPTTGFTGEDRFSYRICDGASYSATVVCRVQVRTPAERAGSLVVLVVNATLLPNISNEVARLREDLLKEGYTAKITPWSDGSVSNLWNYLRQEYSDTNQWLAGTLLIGSLPKPQEYCPYEYGGWLYTDLVFWNLHYFQTTQSDTLRRDIWASRIIAQDTTYGTEVALIKRALDANHNYRAGISRLPHTAYYFAVPEFFPYLGYSGDKIVEWLRTVWPAAVAGDNLWTSPLGWGCELFDESSHGNANAYMGGWFNTGELFKMMNQARFTMIGSCTSGAYGGIGNHHIFTRGGGAVLAVGGSSLNWTGDFTISDAPIVWGVPSADGFFRNLLAQGEAMGAAALQYYAFDSMYNDRTIFYGDLSIKAMAAPANALPRVEAFTKNCTTVYVGQPVTFTIAVSDPDANATNSPYVEFKQQVEWFMTGYDYGRNNPTYVTNDTQCATWTNQTHVFTSPGTYTVRAEVMDEWLARSYQELTVMVQQPAVTCTVNAPTNGAVVIEGTNLTITAAPTVTYGSVSNVEFYLDGLKIATAPSSPYSCVWTNAVKGTHVLTAKATDGAGNFTNSTAVSLSVLPITTCTITAPANGSALKAGTDLSITATAVVSAGTVSKVEFCHDGVPIGEATSASYACVWSNVPIGFYALTARAIQSDGRTGDSAAVYVNATASGSWEGVFASGGTVTNYTLGGTNYRAHIFTTVGTTSLTVMAGGFVEVLVVGGGGGGGSDMGGGGGAGGLIYSNMMPVVVSNYTVTVGAGGAGAPAGTCQVRGYNGSDSVFESLIAGGGGGGASTHNVNSSPAGSGGSGGGASGQNANRGTGQPGQGSDGAQSGGAWYPGGGGGAGGPGLNNPALGGVGRAFSISGTNYFYAGGGGGAGYSGAAGNGGLGGGGGGSGGTAGGLGGGNALNSGNAGTAGAGWANVPGGDAGANTGGGGGGGSHYNSNNRGGNGGSGIVIVRYVTGGGAVAPVPPTGFVATAVATNQINLAWTDNASNENGYLVERSQNSNTWELVTLTGVNATNTSDSARATNTLYYYRVAASNAAGLSAYGYASARTWTVYEQWQRLYFDLTGLNNLALSGATADPDHDGLSNAQEYGAGTDPTNAASCLVIYALTNNPAAPAEFVVRWQSVSDHWYTVQAATNLVVVGFTNLATHLPATPPVNVHTDSVSGVGCRFYRVQVE